jgi:hypothetical protein
MHDQWPTIEWSADLGSVNHRQPWQRCQDAVAAVDSARLDQIPHRSQRRWVKSVVLGKSFRLASNTAGDGLPRFTLEVK